MQALWAQQCQMLTSTHYMQNFCYGSRKSLFSQLLRLYACGTNALFHRMLNFFADWSTNVLTSCCNCDLWKHLWVSSAMSDTKNMVPIVILIQCTFHYPVAYEFFSTSDEWLYSFSVDYTWPYLSCIQPMIGRLHLAPLILHSAYDR